jgi:BirA family biotin operon repressor/biotin-[acetyl-CoA-carboxylase] ligase
MDTPIATSNESNLPGVAHSTLGIDSMKGRHWATHGRWQVRWTPSTGSTNSDLWESARAGAPDRLVLVADHQTAGRGRLDRRWEAPAGSNLLVSVLFRDVPEFAHALTHAVGRAAAGASEALCGVRPDLKWPNDLLLEGRKLAGILSSAGPVTGTPARPSFVVVGLGLNVDWAPDGGTKLNARATTSVSRDQVLERLLDELHDILSTSPREQHEQYRRQLSTIGREVRVELPNERIIEGRALDVEADGRLVVLDSCGVTHRLDIGDVVHLR